jgi:hypothetical protein
VKSNWRPLQPCLHDADGALQGLLGVDALERLVPTLHPETIQIKRVWEGSKLEFQNFSGAMGNRGCKTLHTHVRKGFCLTFDIARDTIESNNGISNIV